MQREITEQWSEFCKECVIKPISTLAELNVRTLSNATKKPEYFEEFINAKKPEDIINAQIKFISAANSEALKYGQDVFNILLQASSNLGKTFTHIINEATAQAGAVKSASHKSKE